uniref:Uncharacterized protein n=1 Tax=Trypanosoma congolense (strain IL3000) TaxID=1068625 RepID=F9W712_TRYCI|nr:hypothetical protein, unlikely [Trypanosoma congolense IL3000]
MIIIIKQWDEVTRFRISAQESGTYRLCAHSLIEVCTCNAGRDMGNQYNPASHCVRQLLSPVMRAPLVKLHPLNAHTTRAFCAEKKNTPKTSSCPHSISYRVQAVPSLSGSNSIQKNEKMHKTTHRSVKRGEDYDKTQGEYQRYA